VKFTGPNSDESNVEEQDAIEPGSTDSNPDNQGVEGEDSDEQDYIEQDCNAGDSDEQVSGSSASMTSSDELEGVAKYSGVPESNEGNSDQRDTSEAVVDDNASEESTVLPTVYQSPPEEGGYGSAVARARVQHRWKIASRRHCYDR
jgi:hypothetical protein